MPAETSELMTADDLLHVDIPGKCVELVKGRLVVREPPATWHGQIAAKLTYLLGAFVYERDLGLLCAQDTGFRIASDPDTVRAPDVAFIPAARAAHFTRTGYEAIVPELVVEIVSPSDRPGELLRRAGDWLAAGARLVWVIHSAQEVAYVHRADGSIEIVAVDGALQGEDVLPGFSCALAEVLR